MPNNVFIHFLLQSLILFRHIKGMDNSVNWTISYKKPKISNAQCFDAIDEMAKAMNELKKVEINAIGDGVISQNKSSSIMCLGCSVSTQDKCPVSNAKKIYCQQLIDKITRECDGPVLSSDYFYDPPENNIPTGSWNEEVQRKMSEKASRCGCSDASTLQRSLTIPLALISFFSFLFDVA